MPPSSLDHGRTRHPRSSPNEIHLLERLPGYGAYLRESLERRPAELTLWMANRILNTPTGDRSFGLNFSATPPMTRVAPRDPGRGSGLSFDSIERVDAR